VAIVTLSQFKYSKWIAVCQRVARKIKALAEAFRITTDEIYNGIKQKTERYSL
jgi:hypothetical protein